MEGSSIKLAFLLLIVAAASVLVPLEAEARCKEHKRPRGHYHHHHHHHHHHPHPHPHPYPPTLPPSPAPSEIPPYQIHGCGYPCSDSNDCDAPCTVCCANQTCCYDEPMPLPPSPLPPPQVIQAPAPAPIIVADAPDVESTYPPYQIHGCGYPCSDSNDCDWPCTMCCYQNQTCCYDESMPQPTSPPAPPIQAPATAPAVADGPDVVPSTYPPYQIHGCGYPCSDSNDCDWPCTMCCYENQTCCYDESMPLPPSPSPSLLPLPLPPPQPVQAPAPTPIIADAPDVESTYPPYKIHGCGYPCSDSNDCDWPCTMCCSNNQTCCNDQSVSLPSFPLPPLQVIHGPAQAPNLAGTPDYIDPSKYPPYQTHGCGYPCSDSNDCDWPCTMCCSQNQTCCNDESIPPPQTYPPYQMHGCGYPCNDSNDCDWPCTMCCYHSERNQTCC